MKAHFAFLFLLLLAVAFLPVHATPVEVSDVSISSSVLHKGDNATVTIVFAEDIAAVSMLYCQLTPEYSCHFPLLEMTATATHIYTVTFKILEDEGSKFGFEFRIKILDNSTITYPETSDPLFGFKVTEPLAGFFYFTINVGTPESSTPTSTTPFPLLFSGMVLLVLSKKH